MKVQALRGHHGRIGSAGLGDLDRHQILVQRIEEHCRAQFVVAQAQQQPIRRRAGQPNRDTVREIRRLETPQPHGQRCGGHVHGGAEAHQRLTAELIVESSTPRHRLRLSAGPKLGDGHRRDRFEEIRCEHRQQRHGQLGGAVLDHHAQARSEEGRTLDDPFDLWIPRPARTDVESCRDVRMRMRQISPVHAKRLELGDIGIQKPGIDHRLLIPLRICGRRARLPWLRAHRRPSAKECAT